MISLSELSTDIRLTLSARGRFSIPSAFVHSYGGGGGLQLGDKAVTRGGGDDADDSLTATRSGESGSIAEFRVRLKKAFAQISSRWSHLVNLKGEILWRPNIIFGIRALRSGLELVLVPILTRSYVQL